MCAVQQTWYIRVGLQDARKRFVKALDRGDYGHEERDDKENKNWLATGRVSPEEVITMLHRCRGHQYEESTHFHVPGLTVHVFRPRYEGTRWYIKGYFTREGLKFFSVHPSR